MIKIFITAIESRDDGTAVTLFEDYQLDYDDKDHLYNADDTLNEKVYDKIEEVEKINNETSRPF